MFHDATSSGARLGGTPVSRFRPRAFPWLFCKTGFAASMPRGRYRAIGDGFCSVKVKLTKRLAVGAGLLGSAHSIARRFSVRVRRNCYTGRRQAKFGRRAGRVDVTPDPCAERSAPTREGFLRALPFLCLLKFFDFYDARHASGDVSISIHFEPAWDRSRRGLKSLQNDEPKG